MHYRVRIVTLVFLFLSQGFVQTAHAAPPVQDSILPGEQSVILLGKLTDFEQIELTSNLAAARYGGIVLLDSTISSAATKNFLAAYQPDAVIPVGPFPDGTAELERRLGVKVVERSGWESASTLNVGMDLIPKARQVLVSPAQPRGLLLQAACLAGTLRIPLYVLEDKAISLESLPQSLKRWEVQQVYAVASAIPACRGLSDIEMLPLVDEAAIASAQRKELSRKGFLETLVVTNPADASNGKGKLSQFAPWLATQRDAALLFTNKAGDNTTALVSAALKNPEFARVDSMILLGGLKAIRTERRINPVPGKDEFIEMEPMTPKGTEPFTLATGRLFHDDPAMVLLTLARQRLLARPPADGKSRKALVVSNPGGGLSLLETFSRNTSNEFRNRGFETTARFDSEVTPEEVRKLMPHQDIFLWEGHYRTMVDKFELPKWNEPMRPSLVFLQSCLALNEAEGQPLMQRGAVSIIGSSTRTYSASGGAFTLAFFDSLLYDGQTLGGGLRQAKNFLLAYSLLKEKRLGEKAKLGGANLRSSWAFTLWGDPTLKLPLPPVPETAMPPVQCVVEGNTVAMRLPEAAYKKMISDKYQAQMWPNTRLAGLLNRDEDEELHLVPFLFAEVRFAKTPANKAPRLTSNVPSKHWVFCWDARRKAGYLLVAPRAKDEREVTFHVSWDELP